MAIVRWVDKTLRDLSELAEKHGDTYQHVMIAHGSEKDVDDWIREVNGAEIIKVISDPEAEIYRTIVLKK